MTFEVGLSVVTLLCFLIIIVVMRRIMRSVAMLPIVVVQMDDHERRIVKLETHRARSLIDDVEAFRQLLVPVKKQLREHDVKLSHVDDTVTAIAERIYADTTSEIPKTDNDVAVPVGARNVDPGKNEIGLGSVGVDG